MGKRPFRPGFDHTVEAAPRRVAESIAALAKGSAPSVSGNLLDRHFQLSVPRAERHFWSPWLHLEIEPHRSEGDVPAELARRSYVRGYFTPAPSLWTGFALSYIALATLVFLSATWGVVQLQLGQVPVALWVTSGSAGSAFAMFIISRVGRGLAAPQMEHLHTAVESALEAVGAVHPGSGPKQACRASEPAEPRAAKP